jgi:hypothetical protein
MSSATLKAIDKLQKTNIAQKSAQKMVDKKTSRGDDTIVDNKMNIQRQCIMKRGRTQST